jgi:hypothetical protein
VGPDAFERFEAGGAGDAQATDLAVGVAREAVHDEGVDRE